MRIIVNTWLLLLFASVCFQVQAQGVVRSPATTKDSLPSTRLCGVSAYPPMPSGAWQASLDHRSVQALPEVIGVYFHVIKDDAGNGPGTNLDTVLDRFEVMRSLYSPSVCFILAGIGEIHNSDLDTQYFETEESELLPYLKPNLLNVFIHNYLASYPGGGTAGGWAYDIPNTYFSWWELNVVDPLFPTVVAHETGHCLGLYHTHEGGANGIEYVDRTGGCKNCETHGDLLCDTPADPDLSIPGYMAGCTYVGNAADNCGFSYVPDPANVMAYSQGICQDQFTTGQLLRVLSFLYGSLSDLVVPSAVAIVQNGTHSSGEYFHLAEEHVVYSAANLQYTGTAKLHAAAGNSVQVLPGTTFSPSGGFMELTAQAICD